MVNIMGIQNRVTPFGCVIAHTARGLFTGNRGVIHCSDTKQLHPTRRWTTKAWIYCLCEFKQRRREVFGANGPNGSPGWTNLFFRDEATALAAGHRPCFYCQRARATEFQKAFSDGNKLPLQKAPQIDKILHAERLQGKNKRLHVLTRGWHALPDGAMIAHQQAAYLVYGSDLYECAPGGYTQTGDSQDQLFLLTPPAIVLALRAGFKAQISLLETADLR